MKRLLLSVLCFLLILPAFAQISKGEKMIGGELSFKTGKDENQDLFVPVKSTSFTIAPQIGFGLQKNWIVGGGLGYGLQVSKEESDTNGDYYKQTINAFSFAVFARKFHPFNDHTGIYGQLDVGAGFGKGKQTSSQGGSTLVSKGDVNTITAMIKPGFYFKATKSLVLEASFGSIGYTNTTSKPENERKITSSEFGVNLTSTLGFGFQVIF